MKHGHFIKALDEAAVIAAIRAAEQKTSGQIRVFVSMHRCRNALAAGQRQFWRLGMYRTKQHNGVLLFIAPKSQTFAVIGDVGIHRQCGGSFWEALRDEMTPHFKSGSFTQALVHGVERAGALLQQHFPHAAGAENEISDAIAHD